MRQLSHLWKAAIRCFILGELEPSSVLQPHEFRVKSNLFSFIARYKITSLLMAKQRRGDRRVMKLCTVVLKVSRCKANVQ